MAGSGVALAISKIPGLRLQPGNAVAHRKGHMPKLPKTRQEKTNDSDMLKGWRQIAEFLGQPVSVAERWAKSGMPITRQGRSVVALSEELNKWLGRESGEPVHVATPESDLAAELKRGLAYVRGGKHHAHADTRVHK
jgi:hypothetical protein